jgi:hypothetical protein
MAIKIAESLGEINRRKEIERARHRLGTVSASSPVETIGETINRSIGEPVHCVPIIHHSPRRGYS